LGTREIVKKIKHTFAAITPGADTKHTESIVFAKAFVNAPEIIGIVNVDGLASECALSVDSVTTTGMEVNIYQSLAANLTGTPEPVVEISLVGWKAS
jgi:hypothetical protein